MLDSPQILDGRRLASHFEALFRRKLEECRDRIGRAPGLAVILVGDNQASRAYVARKEKVAKRIGFESFHIELPASTSQAELTEQIQKLNSEPQVDGILLQLPLPDGLDSSMLLDTIAAAKDVDGLHPLNQGLLIQGRGKLLPCTPLGCMKLIDLAFAKADLDDPSFDLESLGSANLASLHAVVIGRSILVGKPVAQMLLERGATVSIAHSKTANIASFTSKADILVAAVGKQGLVGADWIKPGAVVIDVGINRNLDGKLVGDCDFDSVAPLCSAITPVPGGVGPMTVAMLMRNTLEAYLRKHNDLRKRND